MPAGASSPKKSGPVFWMANNPVAANLLMIFLLLGGYLTARTVKQEVFPAFDMDIVTITVPYPGASPDEVEKGVVLALEEAVRGLDGVKRVTATAAEGAGAVSVELLVGTDGNKALQDIKNAVDRITTFPEETERPQVTLLSTRREVISVVVYGEADEATIRALAEKVREDLLKRPEITSADLSGVRPLEISVEIPQATLRSYGLTLGEVAARIRRAAVELPGGGVKTAGGEVLLRVAERRETGSEFAEVPIIDLPDGTRVRLGDVATITDGFAETDASASYNGQTAAMVDVYRVGKQTPIEVAGAVKEYVKKAGARLPPGLHLATWNDRSEIYEQRLSLLLRNASLGLVLVLVLLGLFLEVRLAIWVTMGIPVSFLGAMLVLPVLGVTINMISLFAFIMSLGMVVDDAIVVGENIYKHRQMGEPFVVAAVRGTREVAMPVCFAIATNIAAFMPMFFVPGVMGKIFRVIPAVVISVFIISLVEALFILPAHLGHTRPPATKGLRGALHRVQQRIAGGLEWVIERLYRPLVARALRYRYVTVAIGVAVLLVTLGYIKSGRMAITRMPRVESDRVVAAVELPYGSPVAETRRIRDLMLAAARRVIERNGGAALVRGIFTQVGSGMPRRGPRHASGGGASAGHLANVQVFMVPSDQREIGAQKFKNQWEKELGRISGVETLTFKANIGAPSGGAAVSVRLSHKDIGVLKLAAEELAEKLRLFSAVKDIDDGFRPGKPQHSYRVLPAGRSLGLESREIARQVRDCFYGAEAVRQQRGREEIKVMVRLPEAERRSEFNVEELMLQAPGGGEILLREAAVAERGRAYTAINRADGNRTADVACDVVPQSEAGAIVKSLTAEALPELVTRYPGLGYSLEGERRELTESIDDLMLGFAIAMVAIYAMLAIPFRSYVQPLIIMVSIPFGIVGAVLGHLLMGFDLSLISMFGIVALSGVVVNDSLVLIDFANRRRREGASHFQAVADAGARRFRPIMLTSLTTFGGLAPMIFESSMQARFLIPMALSLGYGILFATVIALLLVPAFYLIVEDLRAALAGLRRWLWPEEAAGRVSAAPGGRLPGE